MQKYLRTHRKLILLNLSLTVLERILICKSNIILCETDSIYIMRTLTLKTPIMSFRQFCSLMLPVFTSIAICQFRLQILMPKSTQTKMYREKSFLQISYKLFFCKLHRLLQYFNCIVCCNFNYFSIIIIVVIFFNINYNFF